MYFLRKVVLTLVFFSASLSYACPILNDVNLADASDQFPVWREIERTKVFITEEEFKAIPTYENLNYEECKTALLLQKLEIKDTGEIFYVLGTNDDSCDGGNVVGALYSSADLKQIIADIQDSWIICRDTAVQ